jgi:hypothetical protein|tara:strand:- start:2139 stop:3242 length:1104 start_codon:yes stop_codon:yes gene_type:complete
MRLFAIYSIILTFFNISFLFAENIYQISNIIANAKMDNPTSSRQLALDEARRRAFIILLQKLKYQITANELFSDQEIEQIIRSQQISDERFADNEYWATLNIFFDKDFVDQYIIEKDLKFFRSNAQIDPYIILPIQITDNKVKLWDKDNIWYQIMLNNNYDIGNKKFIIPEYSIDNISLIDEEKIYDIIFNNINYDHLTKISEKYQVKSFYILAYSYNELRNKAIIDIFYIKDSYKKQTKLSFINTESLSKDNLLNIIAKKTTKYLANQSYNDITTTDKNIYIGLNLSNMGQWLMIKNKLENANFIDNSQTKLITTNSVIFKILLADHNINVENKFQSIGINLSKRSNNHFFGSILNKNSLNDQDDI